MMVWWCGEAVCFKQDADEETTKEERIQQKMMDHTRTKHCQRHNGPEG